MKNKITQTLTALVLTAGMAAPAVSEALPLFDPKTPVTFQPNGKTEIVGRMSITKGMAFNSSYACLMETSPFTTYTFTARQGDTYRDIVSSFREVGVPEEELRTLGGNLEGKFRPKSFDEPIPGYLVGYSLSVTYHPCSEPPKKAKKIKP